jgi:hypothetical protein
MSNLEELQMESKRTVIDTVDENNQPIKLAVVRPNNKVNQEANMGYNLRMAELIRNGSKNGSNRLLLRAELEDYLAEMGIWTMKDQLEVEKLALEIRANELLLKRGGIKISEGRAMALQMAEKRQLILEKHAKRLQFDSATIESHAENFRFEYLLVKCLVLADTGKQFLKDHDEYIEKQDTEAVMEGARILANMIYGIEDNVQKKMFEMKWLKDAGMINDEGRYIKSDGTIIDRDGRLIDKNGRYINKDGQLIDTFGRFVDEHGNLLVDESKPFIDDETGKAVIIGEIGKKSKTKKIASKRKRKKKVATK